MTPGDPPRRPFDLEVLHGSPVAVRVGGEIDLHTAPRLRDCLRDLRAAGVLRVELDLAGVSFCDSSALGLLIGEHRRFDVLGGDLALREPSPSVVRLLEVSGIDHIVRVVR